jgi:NADPH:quinone reductase-like Zn-dependent oxidoreductase
MNHKIAVLRKLALTGFIVSSGLFWLSGASAETTRQYVMEADGVGFKLVMREAELPALAEGEVLVRVRAVSLNRRDLTMLSGSYRVRDLDGKVPVSDGAGEVMAVGPGVLDFEVGDRVAGTFFMNWDDGPATREARGEARGGEVDGMLSEWVVAPGNSLVTIPAHLSFEEAATLPCAALTAWNGLFKYSKLKPGEYVLLEGTGGVSVFGLQFSAAAGARPVITSSSDAKLEKAKQLGAIGTVNYRSVPDWEVPVREITGDAGVDHVLEVGGNATIEKAIASLSPTGHLARIGGLTGRDQVATAEELRERGISASQLYVGSRADFEAMNAFIVEHELRPVIDRVFTFEETQEAFDYMDSNAFFGKIVIRL